VIQEFRDAQPERKIIADINVARAVRCDIRRLQQVASNLLGNALSHGRASGPITITATADGQDFVLQVWNAGEPIPPEYMERIFEPFSRPAGGGSQTGLGLGLHICAAIVSAHGGRIAVTSTQELGTEITVRFPLGVARPKTHNTFHPIDTPTRDSHASA
jgi:signal transduction histidine kinase